MEESDQPIVSSPRGICDCHIHIYGPASKYPVAPTTPFPVPDAPLNSYRQVMRRLGIDRAVVVQPTAYASDNRCTMDAVREMGVIARGVVVVDADVSEAELAELTVDGACGVRFHLLPGGILPLEILEGMAARVHEHGWHVQLQMDGRLFEDRFALLDRLPCNLVIDHTGKFLTPVSLDHPSYKAMLRLLANGRTWVKLSAPYETSVSGAPGYEDVGRLARGLIAAAPERMVWASNWPHPSAQEDPPDERELLRTLKNWVGDDALTNQILKENPDRLYGF